ncbi:MAG: PHP domain-containing protein [Candidatus Heimdallarchaeota archaeon]|nr:PHP domain-containing protein [Candidatus Heimdallarchaeota archaeon]MCK4878228.1 PHP domain-containing protein [Candidatus Heimdallarchaeota archaeon]
MHCHSNFSDGLYTPKKLLEIAARESLDVFSITDHDNLEGTKIANEISSDYSFLYLTGIEISARHEGQKIEILGYNFDPTNDKLLKKLVFLQDARKERVHKIIHKLNEIDIKITWEDVVEQIGAAVSPGRPHFARAMMKKKYVTSVTEAFDLFIGEGKPAYVKRVTITPKEAIELINEAGGIAVIPHPLYVEFSDLKKLKDILDMLLNWGLQGVEVYYNYRKSLSNLSKKQEQEANEFLLKYCRSNNLLVTGGTDFHGDTGKIGEVSVPNEIINEIITYFS